MSDSQALTEFDMVTVQSQTGLRQSGSKTVTSHTVSAAAADLSKVIHGFVDIDYSAMFDIQYDRTTRAHDLRIRKCHSNVNARKFHFCRLIV